MATHTHQFNIGGATVNIRARKALAEQMARLLARPFELYRYKKQISGIHGVEKRERVLRLASGNHGLPIPDVEQWRKECEQLLELYTSESPITPESYPKILFRADEVFFKYVPVDDRRHAQPTQSEE